MSVGPDRKRGYSSLKKDVFAVITFVATGFLFYLIQAHDPTGPGVEKVSGAAEPVSVEESVPDTPVVIRLEEGGSRDS
jgi:hypothetical protein